MHTTTLLSTLALVALGTAPLAVSAQPSSIPAMHRRSQRRSPSNLFANLWERRLPITATTTVTVEATSTQVVWVTATSYPGSAIPTAQPIANATDVTSTLTGAASWNSTASATTSSPAVQTDANYTETASEWWATGSSSAWNSIVTPTVTATARPNATRTEGWVVLTDAPATENATTSSHHYDASSAAGEIASSAAYSSVWSSFAPNVTEVSSTSVGSSGSGWATEASSTVAATSAYPTVETSQAFPSSSETSGTPSSASSLLSSSATATASPVRTTHTSLSSTSVPSSDLESTSTDVPSTRAGSSSSTGVSSASETATSATTSDSSSSTGTSSTFITSSELDSMSTHVSSTHAGPSSSTGVSSASETPTSAQTSDSSSYTSQASTGTSAISTEASSTHSSSRATPTSTSESSSLAVTTSSTSVAESSSSSTSVIYQTSTTSGKAASPSSTSSLTTTPLNDRLVAGYYPDWSVWTFPPSNLDFSRLDVVDFAFAIVNAQYGLEFTQYNSEDTLNWLVSVAHAAGKKVRLSVGGWTGSVYFSPAVATANNRQILAQAMLSMYNKFNLDGIDIDWEYPGVKGADSNIVSSDDSANYLLFLQLLRKTLPPTAILSAATQVWPFAGPTGAPLSDVSEFAKLLDWVMIMNYDIWGSSADTPGPNAPLSDGCGTSAQPLANAYAAVSSWTTAGMPAKQIVLGLPAYGYMQASAADSLRTRRRRGMEKKGGVTLYNADGGTSYGQIKFSDMVNQGGLSRDSSGHWIGAGGFTRYWDTCSSTPWLKSTESGQIITYDDPISISLKAQFAKQAGLRGTNFWEITGDTSDWSLLNAARSGLGL